MKNIAAYFDAVDQSARRLRLVQVHHYTAIDREISPPQRMEHWTLDVSLTYGGLTEVAEFGWQSRAPGWVHLYRPGAVWRQDTTPVKRHDHECAYVLFDGGETLPLAALTDNPAGCARFHDPSFTIFRRLCTMAALGMRDNATRYYAILAEFYRIVDLIACRARPIADGEGFLYELSVSQAEDATLAARVQRWLEHHAGRRLTLEEIARGCAVSVSTLTHAYSRETGESVMDTLAGLRLERARSLLLSGATLKEIAGECGFADESALTRLFRRRFGVAPGVWRGMTDAGE